MTKSDAIQFLKRYRHSQKAFATFGLPFSEEVPDDVLKMSIEALEESENREDDLK